MTRKLLLVALALISLAHVWLLYFFIHKAAQANLEIYGYFLTEHFLSFLLSLVSITVFALIYLGIRFLIKSELTQ